MDVAKDASRVQVVHEDPYGHQNFAAKQGKHEFIFLSFLRTGKSVAELSDNAQNNNLIKNFKDLKREKQFHSTF